MTLLKRPEGEMKYHRLNGLISESAGTTKQGELFG